MKNFTQDSVLFMHKFKPENLRERWKEFEFRNFIASMRDSRKLILFIVFVAIFLDNMLLTTIVPIIPNFLYELEHPNETAALKRLNKWDTTRYECRVNHEGGQLVRYYSNVLDAEIECRNGTFHQEYNVTRNEVVRVLGRQSYIEERHREIVNETSKVGIMFASKAIMQLIANPIVGPLTNKIGYSVPLFLGFVIMFFSTLVFAFGNTYAVLFVARAVQGIGSACSSTSGMGMVADRYTEDKERGHAMSIALSGLALGVLVGPVYGGVLYDFVGKEAPFLILSVMALCDGLLQLLVLKPRIKPEPERGAPIKNLITDPYILIAAGAITLGNMGIAMLEPSMPIWMIANMGATKLELGIAFLPASVSYLIGTNLFGSISYKIGRWLTSLIGMVIISICLFLIPLAKSNWHLVGPTFGLGFAIGMVDSSMMPTMGNLVDLRHVSVYGSVYAVADVAFCLGFAIGPALSGEFVTAFGFKKMLWIIAGIDLCFAPLLYLLRNPPARAATEETKLVGNDPQFVGYSENSHQFQRMCEQGDDEYGDGGVSEGDRFMGGGGGPPINGQQQDQSWGQGENWQGGSGGGGWAAIDSPAQEQTTTFSPPDGYGY